MTAVGPDEQETVTTPGSELFFPRRITERSVWARATPDVGYSEPMVLFAENDCLLVGDDTADGERYVVRWPAGYHPRIGEDGVLEVHNGGGRTIGSIGDRLRIRGTYGVDVPRCNAPWLGAIETFNHDLPVVFNQYDGNRPQGPGLQSGYTEGWPRVRNGCMTINFSDILIWPPDHTVRETPQGKAEVLDHDGRVVASEEASERVRLRGYSVTPDDRGGDPEGTACRLPGKFLGRGGWR